MISRGGVIEPLPNKNNEEQEQFDAESFVDQNILVSDTTMSEINVL